MRGQGGVFDTTCQTPVSLAHLPVQKRCASGRPQQAPVSHARRSDERGVREPESVPDRNRPGAEGRYEDGELGVRRVHSIAVGIARLYSGRPHAVCEGPHCEPR